MGKNIILYAAKLCGDCQRLKAFMAAHNVSYEERDIKANQDYARELDSKTGKQGVPYLVIDGAWVRGYEPGKPFSEDFARKLLGL